MTAIRPTTADVVVVGAGPAGSATAMLLARAGRSVVMLDRATFPRDKCCGDGLTTLALRELENLGFRPDDVHDWFHVRGAVLRSPSGREVHVPLPDSGTFAAVTPRRQLDDALVRLARAGGVDVRDGHAFRNLTQTNDRVIVEADGFTVVARYVIAADGMWSPVRKKLSGQRRVYLGEFHGARQYGSGVTGPARGELHVWFEADLVPGYAWSFPLPDGRVNIGFGVVRDGQRHGREMKTLWAELVRRPHIAEALGPDFQLEGRYSAWPIPASVDEVELASGRVLFVGDAAAASDVMTGEGIGQALLTGRLAAEAIVAAGACQPDAAAGLYRRGVAHHLFADHALSKALGSVLARPWGARGAIRIVGHSGSWGRRNFARWMFEDEPRALLLTPRRWHRDLLSRPGAYTS